MSTGIDAPLEVKDTGLAKGRGLFATARINKGQYVCEYHTSEIYPASQRKKLVERYAASGEGDYICEVRTGRGDSKWMCFDATRCYHQYGRYANHASKGCNIKPSAPVFVRKNFRIGFLAIRDIKAGEELVWDYGDRSHDLPWLKNTTAAGFSPQKTRTEAEQPTPEVPTVQPEQPSVQPEQPSMQKAKPRARPRQRKPNRKYRLCPLGGCRFEHEAKQKLSQHLQASHPEVGPEERKQLVDQATIVKAGTISYKHSPRQTTLLYFLKRKVDNSSASTSVSDSGSEEVQPTRRKPAPQKATTRQKPPTPRKPPTPHKDPEYQKKKTTQHFPRFSSTDPTLVAFHDYLTSLDGGKRSAQKATEIVVDINKYLHFANSEACDMNLLLDDDKLRQYMTKLETSGIGPDGIVSKLNTMTYALRYLSYQH